MSNQPLIFVTGVIAGAVITWVGACKYYEDQIVEVKEHYASKATKEEKKDISSKSLADRQDMENMVQDLGYLKKDETKEEVTKSEGPYVITPDEFREFEDYEKISLTYYSDGVVADDMDDELDDVDSIIGTDSLSHFGEYEDDSVFVRNDAMKADYEILLDNRRYKDVTKKKPRRITL